MDESPKKHDFMDFPYKTQSPKKKKKMTQNIAVFFFFSFFFFLFVVVKRKMKIIFFLAFLALCSQGARVTPEGDIDPTFIPHGWVKQEAPSNRPVSLLVGFKIGREEELVSHLYAAGNPSSSSYGQWWTKEKVDDFVRPGEEEEKVVAGWLKSVGGEMSVKRLSALWMEVRCSVEVAERLLEVKMDAFFHEEAQVTIVRSLEHYSLPEEVAKVVSLVGNVNRFPKLPTPEQRQHHQQHHAPKEKTPEVTTTTPASLQERYNVQIPPVNTTNLQAVVSFLDQYYKPSDLSDFEHRFGFPSGGCAIQKTEGFNNESHPGTECSLDVQYLQFGNCSVNTWDYSTPGATPSGNEPFLNWLVALDVECAFGDCPYVYSLSYQDYENTVSEAYAKAVNAQFEIITMTGRTFFSGSGDWGVGCKDLGYGPNTYSCLYFNPDFISSSPFVVSLGATTLQDDGSEVAVSWSSGGFSDYFPQPSYQSKAVQAYLARNYTPPTSYYNVNGRGFPDLAVMGTNYEVFLDGKLILVGGTSASTPVFAQMVSLLNTLRFNARMPPMGFIHPFLYDAWEQNVGAYRDIVANEPMEHGCCVPGFDCVDGWEPLNGLGVPDFEVLSQLALGMRK